MPVPQGKASCTVQLGSCKDGDGYRAVVWFVQDGQHTADFLFDRDAKVLFGWAVPLGETLFQTREALTAVLLHGPVGKGVPTQVQTESVEDFLRREPRAEGLLAGAFLDEGFAQANSLYMDKPEDVYVPPVRGLTAVTDERGTRLLPLAEQE